MKILYIYLVLPLRLPVALLILGLLFPSFLQAQVPTYKGQAVFIYNFTKYINWPASSDKLTIGILGKSPIMSELEVFHGKKVSGREIEVKQIHAVNDASTCHIVFVPTLRSHHVADLSVMSQQKGILLISEEDQIAKGAAISFVIVNNKLKFKINPKVIKAADLQISNDLLAIAIVN
jgi:hypothetical protein